MRRVQVVKQAVLTSAGSGTHVVVDSSSGRSTRWSSWNANTQTLLSTDPVDVCLL